MNRKWIEAGKTVLIIVLSLSAVLLLLLVVASQNGTVTTQGVISAAKRLFHNESTVGEKNFEVSRAAMPVQAAVMHENGRCGIVYGFDRIDELFDAVGSTVKEAFGSAQQAEPIGEEAWREALTRRGVYFAYDTSIPLPVLASWFSTSRDEDLSVARLIFSCDTEENVILLFSDGVDYYACETSARSETLREQVAFCRPNGAGFAFEAAKEAEVYENVDPYSMILDGMNAALPKYSSSPAFDREARVDLMELLKLNPYAENPYEDKDGWMVYLFSSGTLRINGNGRAVFEDPDGQGIDYFTERMYEDGGSGVSAVESSRAFAADTVGRNRGDSRIYMSEYSKSGDTVTIKYSYYLEGLRAIAPQGGFAAQFTFVGGVPVRIELNYRSYRMLEEAGDILAPHYAAAVYPKSRRLLLAAGYVESKKGIAEADWIIS
jgi:hypothetical protein